MTNDELEKARQEITKDINMFIDLKEKLETSFCKSKEVEKNEERAFQIKLTILQTDVQNYLAIAIAWVAVAGSFIVAEAQAPLLSLQMFIFAGLVIAFALLALNSVLKANTFRKELKGEMEKLSIKVEEAKKQ